MNNSEALNELIKLRNEDQQMYTLCQQSKKIRPSERIMTLAKYSMRISALQVAITMLEENKR